MRNNSSSSGSMRHKNAPQTPQNYEIQPERACARPPRTANRRNQKSVPRGVFNFRYYPKAASEDAINLPSQRKTLQSSGTQPFSSIVKYMLRLHCSRSATPGARDEKLCHHHVGRRTQARSSSGCSVTDILPTRTTHRHVRFEGFQPPDPGLKTSYGRKYSFLHPLWFGSPHQFSLGRRGTKTYCA